MGKVIAAIAGATVIGAGATAAGVALTDSENATSPTATVVRVIDGDTLDVRTDGRQVRIRLLNVDAPETKHPDRPVECLGPEAADYLSGLLPGGTSVTLEYDVEREDRYGRTLAGVRLSDGALVNALVAEMGLGVPVVFGENRKFYPPVRDAHREASVNRVGFFGAGSTCTIPARTMAAEKAVNTASRTPSAGDAEQAVDVTKDLSRDLHLPSPAIEVRALGKSGSAARSQVAALARRAALATKAAAKESPHEVSTAPQAAETPPTRTHRATPTEPPSRTQDPAPSPTRRSTPEPPAPSPRASVPQPQVTPPAEPPQKRPANAAPCRSYAPGGKSWKPIPCP